MNINLEISRLAKYAIDNGLIEESDKIYCINRLLAKLNLNEFEAVEITEESPELPQPILDNILDWAFENGVLEDNGITARDIFDTEIMDCFMPLPSEVIRRFKALYNEDKTKATDFYYKMSYKSNYIRMDRIRKNLVWTADTKYGDILISINLSKPEKDPKAIAAALKQKKSSYPSCLLCKENEGYKGTMSHPARANHRIIPVDLIEDESWFMQYSPYVYYNEHCIVFKGAHEPMKITKRTFERLSVSLILCLIISSVQMQDFRLSAVQFLLTTITRAVTLNSRWLKRRLTQRLILKNSRMLKPGLLSGR